MFSKFNYTPSNSFYHSVLNDYLKVGSKIYEDHEKEVQKCLSDFISEDGIINGSELKEHWFAVTKKDIFISHSHKDIYKVKAFAGWLYETFGLEAFIDSCSWGYCDNLLNKIDKKYCYDPKKRTYNYNLRNYTTSHVHMMLSTALTEMIDKTECIIFFNTPNSINMADELYKINKSQKDTTVSPWIYHELLMTSMLPQKESDNNMMMHESFSRDSKEQPKIGYDVSKQLKAMQTLTDSQLQKWSNLWSKRPEELRFKEEALDQLYKIICPKGGDKI